MTKYGIDMDLSMPDKAAQQIWFDRLTAENEHDLRHMFESCSGGGGVFRVATNCCRNLSPRKEDKCNRDKGFCTPSRGSTVSGIYFDRDDDEQRTACFGLCDQAGNVGMRGKVYTWQ